MNLQALKEAGERLKTGGGGKDGFFSTKILTEEGVPIRLLPEPAILNGIFYFEVVKYWMNVNGKRTSVICSSTFGKDSVIQAEIDEAKSSDDDELLSIVNDVSVKTGLIRQPEFWMAALQLEYKTSKSGELEKIIVVDDRAKVFQCGKQTLLHEMVKVATSRKALAPTKGAVDGIADRVTGSNMLLSKTGKDKLTRYACVLDENCEMDKKYYLNIPNVYEIAKAQCHTMAWQRAAVRNHLYGEPIPAEVQAKEDARYEKAKEALKSLEAAAPAPKPKKAAVHEEEEEAPAPKKKAVPPPPAKKPKAVIEDDDDDLEDEEEAPAPKPKKKQVVLDDEDEEEETIVVPASKKAKKSAIIDDEDEEEDAPAPKKAVAKKKAAPIEDDDDDLEDEDDAPAPVVKKKSATPAAPAKKAAAPKRSILDDVDDLDEDE